MNIESVRKYVTAFMLSSVVLFGTAVMITAQERYIGFWKPGTGKSRVSRSNSWEELTEKWESWSKNGDRLQDLEIVKDSNGKLKFIGVWIEDNGAQGLLAHDNFQDFADAWKESLDDKSKQLIDVEVVQIGSKNYYVGVWGPGNGGSALFQYNDWDKFVEKWKELAKLNRVLIDVETIPTASGVSYVGVWESGDGSKQALYNTKTWEGFVAKWKELNEKDLRLTDVDRVKIPSGGELFVGVWNAGTGGQYLAPFDSLLQMIAKDDELNKLKLDLVDFAVIDVTKPVPPKPPESKPVKKDVLSFSNGQAPEKEPVSGYFFPTDMPAINYPKFEGCGTSEREMVEKAWAMAHHNSWRALQLFQFLDKAGANRDDLWKADYIAKNLEERKSSYSPFAFFGPYAGGTYGYELIRDAIFQNWQNRYMKKMTVRCRTNETGGSHPCYQDNPGGDGPPSANHIVEGTINFCNKFFDVSDDLGRVRTLQHEMFHWLMPKGMAILDTHSHWDRNSKGGCRMKVEKMYGLDNAMHLATSEGCWNDPSFHLSDAARNNDNYAWFILRLGIPIFKGALRQFPKN